MMRAAHQFAAFAALAAILATPVVAQSSQGTQPAQPSTAQPAAKSGKGSKDSPQKSTAQQNPFPEAQSEAAAHPGTSPADSKSQSAPSAPAPQTQSQGKSTAEQNPFPEAQSEKAQKQAQQAQQTPERAPSAQPDSSSSAIKGLNPPQSGAGSGQGTTLMLSPSRGKKDVKVGEFYFQTGDYKGAYSRFLEATQVDPGDAEAVYGLAESARHLGDRKVAVQNYQIYLSALPNGRHAKDCRRALKDLGAKP